MYSTDVWNLYVKAYYALKEALPGAILRHDPSYTKSHYYTPTPRTTIELNGIYLGEIMYDKDQCSPTRYFSYYTAITGGKGFHDEPTIDALTRIFKLQYAVRAKTISMKGAVLEAQALGLHKNVVLHYFGS